MQRHLFNVAFARIGRPLHRNMKPRLLLVRRRYGNPALPANVPLDASVCPLDSAPVRRGPLTEVLRRAAGQGTRASDNGGGRSRLHGTSGMGAMAVCFFRDGQTPIVHDRSGAAPRVMSGVWKTSVATSESANATGHRCIRSPPDSIMVIIDMSDNETMQSTAAAKDVRHPRLYDTAGNPLPAAPQHPRTEVDPLIVFVQERPFTAALTTLVVGYLLGKIT